MTLAIGDFITKFPEFTDATASLVQSKLDEAGRRIDASLFGDVADDAQGYLAAHLLALSPFGNAAKMVAKDGSTTYETHWAALLRSATCGLRST